MKAPKEIAAEVAEGRSIGGWSGLTENTRKIVRAAAQRAIELDRAQRNVADREGVRAAVAGVLFNASNYPERVQARMLGQDTTPMTGTIVDAIFDSGSVRDRAEIEREVLDRFRDFVPPDVQDWVDGYRADRGDDDE